MPLTKLPRPKSSFHRQAYDFVTDALSEAQSIVGRDRKTEIDGHISPAELLRGLNMWPWDTKEVLAMIEWMREFNQSGKGRIEFTGFDMQAPAASAKIVREFAAKYGPDSLPAIWRTPGVTSPAVPQFTSHTGSFAAQSETCC